MFHKEQQLLYLRGLRQEPTPFPERHSDQCRLIVKLEGLNPIGQMPLDCNVEPHEEDSCYINEVPEMNLYYDEVLIRFCNLLYMMIEVLEKDNDDMVLRSNN